MMCCWMRLKMNPCMISKDRFIILWVSVTCTCCGILYYCTINPLIRRDFCFSGWLVSAAKLWCSLCVVAGILLVVVRVRWADSMDDGKEHEKPEHPRAKANVFSAITFWYDRNLFVRSETPYVSVSSVTA